MLVGWFSSLCFQTRCDKKLEGGKWKGSAKIGSEKEKAGVYAVCEETNEKFLCIVWLLYGLSKAGEVLSNQRKCILSLIKGALSRGFYCFRSILC